MKRRDLVLVRLLIEAEVRHADRGGRLERHVGACGGKAQEYSLVTQIACRSSAYTPSEEPWKQLARVRKP
jgi:hypothetical protein